MHGIASFSLLDDAGQLVFGFRDRDGGHGEFICGYIYGYIIPEDSGVANSCKGLRWLPGNQGGMVG